MSLIETIKQDIVFAMKSGDHTKRDTLRQAVSALKNAEIEAMKPLDESQSHAVLARMVKQLIEAKVDFVRGARADLVAKADAEITILTSYLPAQMADDELRSLLQSTITELGLSGADALPKVMGAVMPRVKGKADGNRVREIAMAILKG